MPQFLSLRFHDQRNLLNALGAVIIIVFFVPYTASGFAACGKLFHSLFRVDYMAAMLVSALVIVGYTILGGFRAVTTTDLIQSVVMSLALVAVLGYGIVVAGGWGAVVENAQSLSGYLTMTASHDAVTGGATSYSLLDIVSTMAWGLGYFGMPHILLRFMAIEDEKKLVLSRRIATVWVVIAMAASILIGMVVGALIIIIVGAANPSLGLNSAWEGIRLVFGGLFSTGRDAAGTLTFGFNSTNLGNMLFRATPLILTGLSVAVAFKTGLFNIGAPGQYLMGTAATLILALTIPTETVPAPLVWLIAFLGGMLAGALWGCIPGLVKAFLNINEVLACIMTNWIAANLVTWLFDKGSLFESLQNHVENTKTAYIYKTSFNGVETAKLGLDKLFPNSQVNGGILIAIGIAILIYILMNKTTLGYELKACGANRHAARYAGIADKRNIVLSMAIAGALSGAAASLYYLSGNTEFFWSTYQTLPATGFNGIPVALLAVSNPIGVIFTGCFMSMLDIVGLQLTNLTAYNEYITDVIIAIIVYLSAFSLVIKMFISGQRKRRSKAALPAAEAAAKPPEGGGGAEVEKGGESA